MNKAKQAQQGFTLLEVMITMALVIPSMAVIFMCTERTSRNIVADDNVAKIMETLQRSAVRIGQIARPGSLSSFRVKAREADVTNLMANQVGDWMEPIDGETRETMQFRSATGRLSMNAQGLTSPRSFVFLMDPEEEDNDADDDGDGLVDEGKVLLEYDGNQVVMASNVEGCEFNITGRTLRIVLRAGLIRRGGTIQRFSSEETLYLRNN